LGDELNLMSLFDFSPQLPILRQRARD
jgi:hypothetical protein